MENRLYDKLKIKRQNDFHMISAIKIKRKNVWKIGNIPLRYSKKDRKRVGCNFLFQLTKQ